MISASIRHPSAASIKAAHMLFTGVDTPLMNIPEHQPFNSLWPSDAICWIRSGSTLAHVMACCLAKPSHYLNQYWLIINEVLWQSFQGNAYMNIQLYYHPSFVWSFKIISLSSTSNWFVGAMEWGFLSPCSTSWLLQHFRITKWRVT